VGLTLNQDAPVPPVTPATGLRLDLDPNGALTPQAPLLGLHLGTNPPAGTIRPNTPLVGLRLDMDCECPIQPNPWGGMPTEALGVSFGFTHASIVGLMFLTSRPYPVDATDALGSTFVVDDMYLLKGYIEAMDPVFSLQSASARNIVHVYTMTPEAMDASFSLSSASLRNMVHLYTEKPEALDSLFTLESASMRQIVITYTMKPEALDVSFGLLSATIQ